MRAARHLSIWLLLSLPGCAFHLPQHCKQGGDTRSEQKRLLEQFDSQRIPTDGAIFTVFAPKRRPIKGNGSAVLVLHEMAALSPDVLQLGLRLADRGYSVYIPLLWGTSDENANSKGVFLRHALELSADPRWRAMAADVNRPILDELASLCQAILRRHRNQRMGVIGNCLTGIFPFALAARMPQVVAPIASQPTIPITLSGQANNRTGLSMAETQKLQKRIQDEPAFQMLAFRFDKDVVSPSERFVTLGHDFGQRFLDGTIPVELYHGRDRLPRHVHSVLTDCSSRNPTLATSHAWRECLGFLQAKLGDERPRRYRFHPYR